MEDIEEFCLRTKLFVASVKRYMGFFGLIFGILSLAYFVFWFAIMNEPLMFEYGGEYFAPLAKMFMFDVNDFASYQKTSLILAAFGFGVLFLSLFTDNISSSIVAKKRKEQMAKYEQLRRYRITQEYLEKQKELKRNNFSIALSLDYKCQKAISKKTQEKLSYVIFENLKQRYSKKCSIYFTNDVLTLISNDIKMYDKIYDEVLLDLSKMKRTIKNKYDIDVILTITTDALDVVDNDEIVNSHFEIKKCNFKNKSISTDHFSTLYQRTGQNKYIGVPIGEYTVSGSNKVYELNMVSKNLNKMLLNIC